jgi:exodeoxyribonuclease VIII
MLLDDPNALHVMLDLEALATTGDAAIVQIGAVAFTLGGKAGAAFHRHLYAHPAMRQDPATLDWHKTKGTYPPPTDVQAYSLRTAIFDFNDWLRDLGTPDAVWSWGSTYDFPILAHAHLLTGIPCRWKYWQQLCARTVWQCAFGDARHAPRPHNALEDARAAVADLQTAWKELTFPRS